MDFANSTSEQKSESDILIVLENCSTHSNILVGKAPFLASLNKPVICISPQRSELRGIIDDKYIALYSNQDEIEQKLDKLIIDQLKSNEPAIPFNNYFIDRNFKSILDEILITV